MPVAMLGSADTLDRQSGRRPDADYLERLASDPLAQFMFLDNLDPVVRQPTPSTQRSVWFPQLLFGPANLTSNQFLFLGVDRHTGHGHFAFQTDDALRTLIAANFALDPPADFRTLASSGVLPPAAIAQAGLARSLFAWHANDCHCGRCATPTTPIDGGWKRHCAPCERDVFPRLDPVVIMLVTDGERCVLAHEPRYPDGMFSTIAGYIEPGEDIPHAVARESFEELGLTIDTVTYHASQPWPFPHSLMIGCIARCKPASLIVDPAELDEARWFSREEAASMIARTHPQGLWVPGPQAIAHHLIQAFLDRI